ncbi:RsmD family RNA methyltransferase (plasmid) [Bernardetia sp. Wsw4-3y2]|uniref:THUMP-like domain-containing protein n=1 Tax=Bernardetia sp. Wsw4-3y2 TaxID=3127471 RepID=UPI0030CE53C6
MKPILSSLSLSENYPNYNALLQDDIQSFIEENKDKKITQTLLNLPKEYQGLQIEIGNQIKSLQKSKSKLALWYTSDNIIFPPSLSIEQASSEITAEYKASLIENNDKINGENQTLVDLTGGMGVDSFYFSKKVKKVIYIEQNELLANIAKHNFEQLGAKNIEVLCGNSEDFLEKARNENIVFDWIYLDPARRDNIQKKVFLLEDSQPNMVELWKFYKDVGKKWLLKTAPLLDIQLVINRLTHIKKVEVVALKNECKEVLYQLNSSNSSLGKADSEKIGISAINLHEQNFSEENFEKTQIESFDFLLESEKEIFIDYSIKNEIQNFLYEPNVAVLKAGAFKSIAKKYQLNKFSSNTHLYTSQKLKKDFVGKIFKIIEVISFSKKEVKRKFGKKQLNVVTRNFPMSVKELRKQFSVLEGDNQFLFFTTITSKSVDEKIVILCEKIKS